MTTTDDIRAIFTLGRSASDGLVGWVDDLIRVAQRMDVLHLEGVWDLVTERRLLTHMTADPPETFPDFRVGAFRSMLARTLVLGQHETGVELNLYGDRFSLIRSSGPGPVRLEFEVVNTPACQRLRITRHPITMADVRRLHGQPEAQPQPSPAP